MIENKEFKKTIQLSEQDYIDFNNHYHRNKNKFKYIFIFGISLLLSLFVLFLAYNDPNIKYNTIPFFTFMFFFSFIVLSIFFGILYYLFRFLGSKLYKRIYKKNELMRKEAKFTLNELGIESKTDTTCTSVTWSQIHKIEETDKAFYFFYLKTAAFVLPRRYIDSLQELSELKELIVQFSGLQISYISNSRK